MTEPASCIGCVAGVTTFAMIVGTVILAVAVVAIGFYVCRAIWRAGTE